MAPALHKPSPLLPSHQLSSTRCRPHQVGPATVRAQATKKSSGPAATERIKSSTSRSTSATENAVLRLAWYGSELLGIAVSSLRSKEKSEEEVEDTNDVALPAVLEGVEVVQAIKADFESSYFVTGNLTLSVYNDDCEFADPAGSFRGLRRFKRNCSNFGSLLVKSNMKLMKWEDFQDKAVGHWKFSCVMSFPWRPILSATGYTEYYFDDQTGRVCRHVEHWNVPKMALLRQIFKPSRWVWQKP